MSNPPESQDHRHLLPANWPTAPKRYLKEDRYGAFTFVWTNLFLGTLGLWAPLVGAWLTGHKPVPTLAKEMMASGSLYLFVIPFVVSIACSVFMAAHIAKSDSNRPWRLDVLKAVVLLVFVVCLFLMPYQVLANQSVMALNAWVQIVVSLLAALAGIYVFCLLKLDVEVPFTEEVNENANKLLDEANNANSNPSDFDS